MYDALGTYEPRPEGTAHALGHREDPHMLARLCRQCYFDMLDAGDQARAFHTAKRLFEQLTGSIDQRACAEAIHPSPEGHAFDRKLPAWVSEDDARGGMVDWD